MTKTSGGFNSERASEAGRKSKRGLGVKTRMKLLLNQVDKKLTATKANEIIDEIINDSDMRRQFGLILLEHDLKITREEHKQELYNNNTESRLREFAKKEYLKQLGLDELLDLVGEEDED
jgi:polyhydroxyalkanoate synthesis regulator phasin